MQKLGKHSKEAQKIRDLEETIKLKNQEIKDIKVECAKQFETIRDLCTCNELGGKLDKLGRIREIADENFLALVKDMLITEETKAKIIELPTTYQSNK